MSFSHTCPKCGGKATAPEGAYYVGTDDRFQVVQRNGQVLQFREVLADAVSGRLTPEEALQRIQAIDTTGAVSKFLSAPEWQGINGIVAIIALIAVLIIYLCQRQDGLESSKELQAEFVRISAQLESGQTTQERLLRSIEQLVDAQTGEAGSDPLSQEASPQSHQDRTASASGAGQPTSKRRARRMRGRAKEADNCRP